MEIKKADGLKSGEYNWVYVTVTETIAQTFKVPTNRCGDAAFIEEGALQVCKERFDAGLLEIDQPELLERHFEATGIKYAGGRGRD